MTRDDAIARSERYFDSGQFLEDLRRRVAYPTESGVPARRPDIRAYLESELVPAVRALGATAAQLLFARIGGDTSPPRDIVLLTRLVVRGSGEIAPPAGSADHPGG